MKNGRLIFALLIVLALFAATAAAQGGDGDRPRADELLRLVDAQNNPFRDATLHYRMRIKEPESARDMEFILLQKGQKRLVSFLSPDDVKGMGFLIQSPDTTYALLPAFGDRIRRLGTLMSNQGFMGSDMPYQDLLLTEFAPFYDAKVAGREGDNSTILELDRKPAGQELFPKLKLWIDRSSSTIRRIEYYDGHARKLRTQIRSDFREDPATRYLFPQKTVFIDHSRNDHETDMTVIVSRFDTGLSDDAFTKRALQGGAK